MYENTSDKSGADNYEINEELENLENLEMKDIAKPKKEKTKKKKLHNIIEDPECIIKKEEHPSDNQKSEDRRFTFSLPPAVRQMIE